MIFSFLAQRSYYIVVQKHPVIVKGPFLYLQNAKDELKIIAKNGKSRMIVEIIDGSIQVEGYWLFGKIKMFVHVSPNSLLQSSIFLAMAVQNPILVSSARGNQKLAGAMESGNFTHFLRETRNSEKNTKFRSLAFVTITRNLIYF